MPLASAARANTTIEETSSHQRRKEWGRHHWPERPEGCFAQRVSVPFFRQQVEDHGNQRQRQRQCVFQLRDPGHAFDVDRVQRKQGGREHRARHAQQPQNAPNQNRRQGVQPDIDQVVPQRRQPPKLVFEPVDRERQRPVVDVRPRHPRARQAAGLEHRIFQQVRIVVPDEPALPGRLINQQDRQQQAGEAESVRPCCRIQVLVMRFPVPEPGGTGTPLRRPRFGDVPAPGMLIGGWLWTIPSSAMRMLQQSVAYRPTQTRLYLVRGPRARRRVGPLALGFGHK